jgi:hypothetical protein
MWPVLMDQRMMSLAEENPIVLRLNWKGLAPVASS